MYLTATDGVVDVLKDVFKGARGLYDERVAGKAREEVYKDQLARQRAGVGPGGDFMAQYGLYLALGAAGLVTVIVLTRK